jgi:hypothetical protein
MRVVQAKKTMKCYIVGLVICAISASAGGAPTLCQKNEDNLFSCSTGKKLISVCASKGWAADRGYLQYRFGPAGKPELTIPSENSTPPAKSANSRSLTFSGGGGAYLRFSAGGYDYVVYTAISSNWGEKAGVAVEKNGKRRAHIVCKGETASELGPDLFRQAALNEDTIGFDVP